MLHGREAERSVLAALLDEAWASRSGVLVLRGAPGVGKSALLQDTVGRASGMQVLRTCGVESEAEFAFAALQQLLRPVWALVERLPTPQRRALRVAFGQEEGAGGERFLVSLAALSLLAEAADQAPVLCVVDDAQWLDDASAQAFVFVARRLQAERIALVVAARDGDERRFDAPGLPELEVVGLAAAAAASLLAERGGAAVAPEVCDRLVERTGGNPLALIELPPFLTPAQLSGADALPSPLPLTARVEAVFLDRANRLPSAAQTCLLVAAADDTGGLASLRAAALTLGAGDDALDAAERSQLLDVRGRAVEFRHPLIRTAIYSGATTGRRQAAHAALARVFADAGDEDRRTWHLAAAAVEPDEAVAAQLERAAERARARGGPEAACAALERAAQLSTEPVPRKRRLVAAAENAWLAGQLDRASESLRAARPLAPEPQLDADIARLRGSIELAAGSATHAQQLLLRAAQDVADVDSVRALDILVVAAEAASYGADAAAMIEIGRLAARLPAQQNPRTEFLGLLLAGFGHVFAGDIGAATPLLRRGLQHAEEQEDDPLAAAGRAAMYVGDDAAALRLTARSVTRAREAGAIGYVVSCLQRLALLEIQAGRWSAATASAGEAVRLARETGQRDLSGLGAVWLALLAALRGDDGAFESAQALAEQATAEGPIRISVDELSWARGVRALGGGHPDSALSCFETIAHPVVRRLASLDAIEAAVQAGRPASAQSYLHRLEAFAEHTAAPWACAGVGHAHGLLAEGADAEEYFEEALVQHARSDRPFERGRTALAYGRLLRRARHRVAARTHLRSALDVFEGLGAGPWIEQARLELRASGETARRRDPSTVQQLTAQELQVARFVARGSSTRDVAAQLFLSPRTIDYHLRNVFAKLGISSRTELANVPLE